MSDPVGLEALRERRRKAALTAVRMAWITVRAQRSDMARIAREWRTFTKRINRALGKYARSVEDIIDLEPPAQLAPFDLVRCLGQCVSDEQGVPLADIEEALKKQEKTIHAAGKKRAKKLARRGPR